eukprot:534540-Prymnesium_polylepis.1
MSMSCGQRVSQRGVPSPKAQGSQGVPGGSLARTPYRALSRQRAGSAAAHASHNAQAQPRCPLPHSHTHHGRLSVVLVANGFNDGVSSG